MIRTIEATIDEQGIVLLSSPVLLAGSRRALVMILDEPPSEDAGALVGEAALLSEASLAQDWNRTEEDEAWSHLQQGTSS